MDLTAVFVAHLRPRVVVGGGGGGGCLQLSSVMCAGVTFWNPEVKAGWART